MFSNEINRQNILAWSRNGAFKINVLIHMVLAERYSDTKVKYCILLVFDILKSGSRLEENKWRQW